MRLSEAIRLGSLIVPEPIVGDISACAITMALKAVNRYRTGFMLPYLDLHEEWPWLLSVVAHSIDCPHPVCTVKLPVELFGPNGWVDRSSSLVFHAFDAHVCRGTMTIEQLSDFIDRIDPTPRETAEPFQTYDRTLIHA